MSRRSFIRNSAAAAALSSSLAAPGHAPGADAPFLAGVAVRDITPEPGIPMWGYSERTGPSTGTLDPLHAKAVVFRAGGQTAAIVALDLGRVPLKASCDRIRAAAQSAGVDQVFLAASHTHHAPAMEMEGAPHVDAIEKAIIACIEEAAAGVRPARLGLGRATFDVSHNRRILTRDGRCIMLWRNAERRLTRPIDHEAGLVKIEDADGQLMAVLVNFACHPVVMGPDNREYSADYPGEMARIVKEAT
ncbi:MAG: neutral/alkaline non-lysosomal ceramidase N-terminal domain-containing protein, partial [Candidatus Hydrogenedentes bacterium]|nr:neutral/alkaline non-lysosomal ceramidase N-terminal domain-containing protein [Candidatus Hydrogenedentota bacterium]